MIKEIIDIIFPGIAVPISWMWWLSASMIEYEITTPEKICISLGTFHHETQGFTRFQESFNYMGNRGVVEGGNRLLLVFPSAFRMYSVEQRKYQAQLLVQKSEKEIADFVYENIGGWGYRGRGPIMLTGSKNYDTYVSIKCSVDLADSVSEPKNGSKAACAFMRDVFEKTKLDSINFNNPKDPVLIEIFKRVSGSGMANVARYRSVKKVYEVMLAGNFFK
jgi:predicted chitinase